MFVVSRHFECISCICITIEFGCYLKVHMDQFCIEYPTQFETQIGPGVKMSLNWRWFFGTLPLHVELAKILVVHSRKKGMRLKESKLYCNTRKLLNAWWCGIFQFQLTSFILLRGLRVALIMIRAPTPGWSPYSYKYVLSAARET